MLPFFMLAVSVITILSLLQPTLPAQAATADTLNFQGRLLTNTGALVPDGTYNVTFNLYNVATAGSSLWTEDRLNTNTQGVTIKNGYFSVYLGQYDPFGALNWDQDMYLGMTIRGTGSCAWGSCTPADSEMTPRFKLTSVPYAFTAKQLVATDSGFKTTLGLATPTQNNTITAPDESGTICLTSGNCAGVGGYGDILDGGQAGAISVGTTNNTTLALLQNNTAALTVNASQLLQFNAYNCSTFTNGGTLTTDSSGNVTCANDDGGGSAPTLQSAYDNDADGSDAEILLTATDGAIRIRDAASTIGNLLVVEANGGTDYLTVTATSTTVNGDLSVTAGNYLSLTGGNTASRPGSPTEGMMYYDTTTDSLLTYANGKWQADRTTTTYIVAASNSTQRAKDASDYVADGDGGGAGDGDQVQILLAIDAAKTSKGTVYLMPGTYYLDALIQMFGGSTAGITIAGSPEGTVLTINNSMASGFNFFQMNSPDDITIRDLKISGNKANQTQTFNGIASSGARTTVQNVHIENMKGSGIDIGGVNGRVINNRIESVDVDAINTDVEAIIEGNIIIGAGDEGIVAFERSTVSNNYMESITGNGIETGRSNLTITGNTINGASRGIELYNSAYHTVTGNQIMNSTTIGINVASTSTVVSGNVITASGTNGITVTDDDAEIVGNTINGSAATGIFVEFLSERASIKANKINNTTGTAIDIENSNASVDGNTIYIYGGSNAFYGVDLDSLFSPDNVRITNNNITDTAGTGNAIRICASCNSTYLADNTYSGTGAESISDSSTTTRYASQLTPTQILQSGNSTIRGRSSTVLTGSIDPIASTTVTGVGTLFTAELQVGDRITVSAETRTIIAIASNTSLTVDSAFSDNANDTAVDRLIALLTVRTSSNNTAVTVSDTGSLNIWQGTAILGTSAVAGSLQISDGSSNLGLVVTAALSADRTYTFPDASGEVSLLGQTIENGELSNSQLAVNSGSGLTGGGNISLGGSRTLSLSDLTADWVQSGGYDIVLDNAGSELRIVESSSGLYYGEFDVGDLTATRLYTFPDASGEVSVLGQTIENGELANNSVTITAGTGMSGGGLVALGGSVTLNSTLGVAVDGTEITNNSVEAVDLEVTAAPTDTYVLSYDSATGGFTWVDPGSVGTQLTEAEVEDYIFDADNGVKTLSSGTLALGSLGYTGTLGDTYIADTLTVGASSTVDDGALSVNVSLLGSSIALGSETTGNYTASITTGNGLQGGAAGVGSTPTLALGNLTANWNQTAAFNIVLGNVNSQLQILDDGGVYYGTFNVSGLASDQTYNFGLGGTVLTSGNIAANAVTSLSAGAGLTGGGIGAVTLDIGTGTGLTVNANDIAVNYGNTAGTAVEGNTTVTVTAGTGLSGGGLLTLGSGGTLTLTSNLGDDIDGAEILDGTIEEADLEATNAATDTYVLTYDNATGGFTWVSQASVGGAGGVSALNGLTGSLSIVGDTYIGVSPSGSNVNLSINANSLTAGQLAAGSVDSSELVSTAVAANSYGSASSVATFTVDADGRLTAAGSSSISINANQVTAGTLTVSQGGTGAGTFTSNGVLYGNTTGALQATVAGTTGQVLLANGSGIPTFTSFSGDLTVSGTGVTAIQADSVALTTDTTGNYLQSISATANGGLAVTSGSGEGATPTIALDYTATLAGNPALVVNQATFASTGLIFEGSTANTIETLITATNPTVDRTITLPDASGTFAVSASGNIALSAAGDITFTGTLGVGSGGTGATTLTSGGVLLGNGAGAITATAVLTNGQLLIGDGTGAPTVATLTQGTGITVTNGAGSITIASTLGTDIAGSEIVDGTIEEVDLEITNAPTDDYVLTFDNATGGFTWIDGGTLGSTLTEAQVEDYIFDADNGTKSLSSGQLALNSLTYTGNLNVAQGGTGLTGAGAAGGVYYSSGTAFANSGAGTAGQCLLSGGAGVPTWGICGGGGAGATTLQVTYDNGNAITTTDNRDILFTLANTTTDSSFITNIATSSTGKVAFQLNGTDLFRVDSAGIDLIDVDVADFTGATVTFDAGEIDEAEIAQDTLDDSEIANDILTAGSLAADSVNTSEIAADAVGTSEIAANAVDASELVSTAVTLGSYGSASSVATFTVDADGRLTAASSVAIAINASAITAGTLTVAQGGTGISSTGAAGGVFYSNGTTLANSGAGTSGQCLLSGGAGSPTWGACGGTVTLQSSYDNGNTITTTDNRNIAFTLANTTTDSSLVVNIALSSTSEIAFQYNATTLFRVDSAGIDLIDVDVADFTGATVTFDAGEIDEAEIAQDTLDDSEIANDILTAGSLAADSVNTSEIAANAVDASELASTTVSANSYGSASTVATFTVDADGRLTAASSTAINIALNTNTTGDYVQSLSAAVNGGLAVTGGTGEGSTPTIALSYADTLASNSLAINQTSFASTGIIFEGAASDGFETLLTVTDPTIADKTITLPNASGTVAVSASGNIALSALGNITFTGTLGVGSGGTGVTTITSGGILFGAGAGAITNSGVLTNGQLLIGDGTGAPTVATLTQGTGITVTNGAGTITIASTLGTDINGTEILDNTIEEIDLEVTNAPTNTYLLSYDSATGGFTWINPASVGTALTEAQVEDYIFDADNGVKSLSSGQLALGSLTYTGSLADAQVADNITISSGGVVAGAAITAGTVANAALTNSSLNVNTGSGLTGGGNVALGSALTVSLSALTADWNQTGAFDILLNNAGSELRVLESAGATYYGTFDVGDLASDQTFTFLQGGTVMTSGNVATYATTGVTAGNGLITGGTVGVVTLDVGAGTGITVNANDIAVNYGATASTAVQGNTQITVTAGTGMTGGGSITLGSGGTVTLNSTLGVAIDGAEITDNIIEEVDLEVTNAPTNGYILSYNSATGGFTWVDPAGVGVNEAAVEAYIFDADNTGTLSSGTLALNSLSYTGSLSVGYGGTGLTSSGAAGGVFYSTGSGFANTGAGTSSQCLLSNGASAPSWGTCGGGGGPTTLQVAYDNGNDITTTDNRNITFNLADTATDSDFLINLLGTGSLFDVQDGGTSKLTLESVNGYFGVNDSTPSYQLDVAGDIRTTNNLLVDGNATLGNASTDLINFTGVANTSLLANNAAGGTARTTEATARTNVTTVTITVAGYANGDVIYINNAGQDYYTRITAGGGTTSLTVDPAVSYDVSAAVTNYTIQNIGAASTGTTFSNTNRFFQGYFLGGVVAGAGTTTLSDGNLNSTGSLVLQRGGGSVGIGGVPDKKLTIHDGNVNATEYLINYIAAGGVQGAYVGYVGNGTGASRAVFRSGGSIDVSFGTTAYPTALQVTNSSGLITMNSRTSVSSSGYLAVADSGAAVGDALLRVGDDTFFTDVDAADTLGLYSAANNAVGMLRFGSGGATIGSNVYTSYSNFTVNGVKNTYTGINFRSGGTNLGTFMVRDNGSSVTGFYNRADNGWDWYWDGGVLAAGTVPTSRITGLGSMAFQTRETISGAAISYGGASLGTEILAQGGGAAGMTFHRPGAFAAHFGLETDNTFRVGGWSFGAASYRLMLGDGYTNGGNLTISGNSQANYVGSSTGVSAGAVIAGAGDVYAADQLVYANATGYPNNACRTTTFPYAVGHCSSLREYKDEITDLPYGLETLRQLRPVQYRWKADGQLLDTGFIAEEVNGVAPIFNEFELKDGVKRLTGVAYSHMTSLLTKAVQQLDLQVQSMDSRLTTAEATLAVLNSTTNNFTKANITVTNITSTLDLTVTGTATITNLKVTGLTEVADLKVNGKIITAGSTPTAVLGATTTGQGSTYTIEGNDTAGTISYTSGTNTILNPLAAGEQVTVTFNVPFTATPRVSLTPITETSASLDYYVTRDVNGFKLHFVTPPAPNTTYSLDYQILQ